MGEMEIILIYFDLKITVNFKIFYIGIDLSLLIQIYIYIYTEIKIYKITCYFNENTFIFSHSVCNDTMMCTVGDGQLYTSLIL